MAVPAETIDFRRERWKRRCDAYRQGMTDQTNLLIELYESGDWEAMGYESFRDGAVKEFGELQRTMYRRLEAALVLREIEQAGDPIFVTCDKNKVSGRSLATLAKAPEGTRAEVLKIAAEAADGVPTEAVVKAAVEAKKANPSATPAELVKTVVNGVSKADRAVEKARAAGKIPADVPVVVEDPGDDETRIEDVAEEHQERLAKADDLPDDEWLATLPLTGRLAGVSADVFRRDALLWRWMQPAFRKYAGQARIFVKASRKGTARSTQGQYAANLSWHLRFSDPSRWLICPPMDKGGCGGVGRIALGPCPLCKERGYLAR